MLFKKPKKTNISLIQVCQALANLLANLYRLTTTAENHKRIWYTVRLTMQQMCITTFSKYLSRFTEPERR